MCLRYCFSDFIHTYSDIMCFHYYKKRTVIFAVFCLTIIIVQSLAVFNNASAMPFYGLKPEPLCLRAQFYTSYPSSTDERKHNIKLATSFLDKTIVDIGGEFSFNSAVGERTEKRGFKVSKIIVGGQFVDGVGGGVCQVSTTLYNAVLLAGLEILEYHPHSLPVSYVAPSFDAMVNSGWADLKFINNTNNPVIIRANADDSTVTIKIYGQKMQEKYYRESVIVEDIPMPEYEQIFDDNLEYPDLFEGESKFIRYGKSGYKSEGYLTKVCNGRIVKKQKIRSDKYNAVGGLIVHGRQKRAVEEPEEVLVE